MLSQQNFTKRKHEIEIFVAKISVISPNDNWGKQSCDQLNNIMHVSL